jgi:hypothetical protein
MAAASRTCFTHGKYGNDNPYPVNLSVAVGLCGWSSMFISTSFTACDALWLTHFVMCGHLRAFCFVMEKVHICSMFL